MTILFGLFELEYFLEWTWRLWEGRFLSMTHVEEINLAQVNRKCMIEISKLFLNKRTCAYLMSRECVSYCVNLQLFFGLNPQNVRHALIKISWRACDLPRAERKAVDRGSKILHGRFAEQRKNGMRNKEEGRGVATQAADARVPLQTPTVSSRPAAPEHSAVIPLLPLRSASPPVSTALLRIATSHLPCSIVCVILFHFNDKVNSPTPPPDPPARGDFTTTAWQCISNPPVYKKSHLMRTYDAARFQHPLVL